MRIRLTWIFALTMICMILVTQSAWEPAHPIIAESLFFMGTFLVGIGAMGRLWCSAYIAGNKRTSLVTIGPYWNCRNPLYFFSFVGVIGIGFATETFTVPAIIAAVFAAYYPQVIRREEKVMAALHGAEFERYKQNVPCFFPQLRETWETTRAMANPMVMRSHLFSALWFVWFLGIAEMVEAFHHSHILPVWFALY